jgi:hypothetical protein
MSPDFINTLGFAMGSAWLSGINLYATVVTLGLPQRFHLVQLPGSLVALQHWWIIGLAGFLYIVEFAADKIPAVDSIWDAVHTFIRIPAGALSSHGTKAATRLAANTSPEPFSNILLSLGEDVIAVGASLLMAFHPVVILVIVGIFLVLALWLARRIVRALRRLFQPNIRAAGSP